MTETDAYTEWREAGPVCIYHEPFIGLMLTESPGFYRWIHRTWLQSVTDSENPNDGAIVVYHDGEVSRTMYVAGRAREVLHSVQQQGRRRRRQEVEDTPDARVWLQNDEHVLAPARFGSNSEAREFVEQLYAAGATHVGAYDEGTYARIVVVSIPQDDMAACRRVLTMINEDKDGWCEVSAGDLPYHFDLWWD